jgi:hypothetical protein
MKAKGAIVAEGSTRASAWIKARSLIPLKQPWILAKSWTQRAKSRYGLALIRQGLLTSAWSAETMTAPALVVANCGAYFGFARKDSSAGEASDRVLTPVISKFSPCRVSPSLEAISERSIAGPFICRA